MGTWGSLPWENDAAADWFGSIFEQTKLAKQVEETLRLDAEDAHEEIRAAATIVLLLGHHFVWPVNDIDHGLELAASRLEELAGSEMYREDPETIEKMRAEAKVLRARMVRSHSSPEASSTGPRWWHF